MATCSICGESRKLIKAHIVPEAFYRELRADGGTPMLISDQPGKFPARAPIGTYDKTILCGSCEGLFQTVDAYAVDVLLKRFDYHFRPVQLLDELIGYESDTVDAETILKFLVAVLWRASVSSHQAYAHVHLAKHQEVALAVVTDPENQVPEIFDAVLSKWRDTDATVPTTAILNPIPEGLMGINTIRLSLGKFVARVKVDLRAYPDAIAASGIRAAPPLIIAAREMVSSPDFRSMRRIAEINREKMGAINGKNESP